MCFRHSLTSIEDISSDKLGQVEVVIVVGFDAGSHLGDAGLTPGSYCYYF